MSIVNSIVPWIDKNNSLNIVVIDKKVLKHYFVALGHEKGKDTLFVHHAENGTPLHKFPVKYANFKDVQMIVSVPEKDFEVALIDQDKGNIMDVRLRKFIRSIHHWGGNL